MRIRLSVLVTVLLTIISTTAAAANTLDQIRERGTLHWGGDSMGGGPYIYDGPDNKLTGFEYELAAYLAKELGVRPEFVQWEWEMLPHILDRGTVDLVLNGYEWSEDRERRMASTIPYYIYKLQLLARSNDDSIKDWDDLRVKPGEPRKRVGVLQGSAAERYMEKRFGDSIELMKYAEVTAVMGLVEQGRLDATIQDVPIVSFYGHEYPGLHAVGNAEAPGYYVGYVRSGDEQLRTATQRSITQGDERRHAPRHLCEVWRVERRPGTACRSRQELAARDAAAALALGQHAILHEPVIEGRADHAGALVRIHAARHFDWLDRGSRPALWVRGGFAVPLEVYVEFLRGTPLLMQLYVLYYVAAPTAAFDPPEFLTGVLALASIILPMKPKTTVPACSRFPEAKWKRPSRSA